MMRFKHVYFENTPQVLHLKTSLRVYNKMAYKQLIFKERFESLNFIHFKEDIYIAELITSKLFEKVYGKVKVEVQIRNNQAKIIGIQPRELLLAGFNKLLPTYKGVPYRNSQDLFKIKLLGGTDERVAKKNVSRFN